ncbi:putative phosphatidic acid phosphatase type 2 [Rhizophagus irregularis DAOM 181602=DAOM 197198]|uniref:Bifunctional diacylglycerol diphosphate phosphatase/phosphatidate phosphatase n=2 Tax=Rhizophagus irregularis TaxID=588596 RepID=A0A015MP62_RHIIW|nr:putative phosphatidic acid phosphatase type 2 [Rhizophagus irregularis DAOM 181602=DAOM 197198]EXX68578.1 bifunctional diacylglycerol diphosphate phosphatase/phosphatidate phosphatase [Rhizophagus irregularis DAOM 197198w]POG65333.1 putative phosphatidic acid phosphatase type 2 [Rhizophagus irregularis DAOM 181602=DAOM 197198]|eukprot:XP_025172199.1 putative phosphatidic acid phosphatase type 2 [Rhizophagus irregularis DAOM 181602=DAOM 197198]
MAQFSKISLIKDWILVIIFIIGCLMVEKIEPFHRLFSLEDKSIQFPYAVKETIPNWLCAILALIIPFIIITFVALVIKRSLHDWHHGSLGLLFSISLALLITETFKVLVGRPRPDFIDRCQPIKGSTDAQVYGLSSSEICTRTDLLSDGFKSFLSGHSSTSFAGLGFLTFYLTGKLHIFDRKGYTYKGFVAVAPLILAIWIAISRTQDYRHHWQDVLAGSILGLVLGLYAYHQFYPLLYLPVSHKPLSVRLKTIKPGYKTSFMTDDGLEFQISVIKKDDNLSHKDNDEVKVVVNDNVVKEEIKDTDL